MYSNYIHYRREFNFQIVVLIIYKNAFVINKINGLPKLFRSGKR